MKPGLASLAWCALNFCPKIGIKRDHEIVNFKDCVKALSLHLKLKTGLKVDHEKTDLNFPINCFKISALCQ